MLESRVRGGGSGLTGRPLHSCFRVNLGRETSIIKSLGKLSKVTVKIQATQIVSCYVTTATTTTINRKFLYYGV